MQRIEYRTVDKSDWGDGPWQDEPDKIQWVDEDTGYPCLIVRNGSSLGFLCGYVGVPANHPAYGLSYDGTTSESFKAAREYRSGKIRKHYEAKRRRPTGPKIGLPGGMSLDGLPDLSGGPAEVVVPGATERVREISVHGGLTFADRCSNTGEQAWRDAAERLGSDSLREQAERYPEGDAARWLREWGPLIKSYDQWKEKCEATYICHKVEDGEDDNVWWFGFDCGHAWDYAPGMKAFREKHGLSSHREDVYRDVAYVTAQCAELAQQLKAMEGLDG